MLPPLLLLLLLLQGVVQPSSVDALPACCFPDPQLRTFTNAQHGSMSLQQLGIGPGRMLVLGMVSCCCCCCCCFHCRRLLGISNGVTEHGHDRCWHAEVTDKWSKSSTLHHLVCKK
jgi:hypothetical protein